MWSLVIVVFAIRKISYLLLIGVLFLSTLLFDVAGLSCKLSVEDFYKGGFIRSIKGGLWKIARGVLLLWLTIVGYILWTDWNNLSGVFTFDCIELRGFVKTFGILTLFVWFGN